jgi:co-chaperonin GroES (HSP10)
MKLKLRGNRLLVVLDKVESREIKPGLFISDKHSERTRVATIKEIGPEVKDFEVGQRVLVSWFTGTRLHLIGQELYGETVDEDRWRVIRDGEIIAEADEG